MTRIITGSARGRVLRVPKVGTRPTSDRVRESVFSTLDHQLGSWSDLAVLDLFAGSGALGLESLSRGAARAVAIESHRDAAQVCRDNAETTGLNCAVVQSEVQRWLATTAPQPFDLVFADPPYETPESDVSSIIGLLVGRGWLADGAVVVVERAVRTEGFAWPPEFEVLRERRFGDTVVRLAVWYFRDDRVQEQPGVQQQQLP